MAAANSGPRAIGGTNDTRNTSREERKTSELSINHSGASLQTAAFEFVPLPFVDDWLIARRRRKLVSDILEQRGIRFERKATAILSDWINRSLTARVRSFTHGLITKPLRKIFRTVFFWLTVRNAVRTLAETYFLGRFVNHPGLDDAIEGDRYLDNARARELADVFKAAVNRIDWRLVRDGSDRIWKKMRQFRSQESREEISTASVERLIGEEYPGFLVTFDEEITSRLSRLPTRTR